MKPAPPITPDGRYLVVRGRLWRCSNPDLSPEHRQALVDALMDARRAVHAALTRANPEMLKTARAQVQAAKVGLGERGPVWWSDGAPDLTRHKAANTVYGAWFAKLAEADRQGDA